MNSRNFSVKLIFYALIIAVLLASCKKVTFQPVQKTDPELTFELIWQEFHNHYPLFAWEDDVDWQATYDAYRPQVNAGTSDEALFILLRQMMRPLNDRHLYVVNTRSTSNELFYSPIVERNYYNGHPTHDLSLITAKYLDQVAYDVQPDPEQDPYTTRGMVKGTNIGYLNLSVIASSKTPDMLDSLWRHNPDMSGLIVDLRNNPGGISGFVGRFAGRFATKRTTYAKEKIKYGPGKNELSDNRDLYLLPRGEAPFTNPVVVLTDRHSFSAAEHITLALKELPQVTHIGDTTGGGFGPVKEVHFGNFEIVYGEAAVLTNKNVSLEGIGIAPDEVLVNAPSDLTAGRDKVLERAIALLN